MQHRSLLHYDCNLKRVKEVRGGKTIYTIYSRLTGGLVYRDEMTDQKTTDYFSVGGAAVRLTETAGGAAVPTYVHFDHLGSAVAASSAAGGILWRERYAPFGKATRTLGSAPANDNNTGFTGHLEDDASGLIYMQSRYYDPLVPRFLSTDPIGYQDQLNLYAYVGNDPVNNVDPTGEFIQAIIACGANTACRAAVGAVIGGAVGGVANAYAEVTDGEAGFNGDRFAARTAIDAATGAALGARPDKAGAIAAAGGSAKAVVTDAIEGDLDPVETAKNMAKEAISSAIGGKAGAALGGRTAATLTDDAAGAAAGAGVSSGASNIVGAAVDGLTSGPPPAPAPPRDPPDLRSAFRDPCESRGGPNCGG